LAARLDSAEGRKQAAPADYLSDPTAERRPPQLELNAAQLAAPLAPPSGVALFVCFQSPFSISIRTEASQSPIGRFLFGRPTEPSAGFLETRSPASQPASQRGGKRTERGREAVPSDASPGAEQLVCGARAR